MRDTDVKFFVKGNSDIVDAALSTADGGAKIDRGVKELVNSGFPHVTVHVSHEASARFSALRTELESGTSLLIDEQPDIVLLSIVDDIREFGDDVAGTEHAVDEIETNLVAVVNLIKEKVGAHVFIANASTLDPAQELFNYHDLSEEPASLRAQRLDLMLIGVSHSEGISIIDVDRKIAELGGAKGVTAAFDYSAAGCQTIAAEIVRVMEDYGFFDDRQLLAQVGARAGVK
ncbi:MAG: hypothetical protein ACC654_10750 [Acidimicrobiia bacterium]